MRPAGAAGRDALAGAIPLSDARGRHAPGLERAGLAARPRARSSAGAWLEAEVRPAAALLSRGALRRGPAGPRPASPRTSRPSFLGVVAGAMARTVAIAIAGTALAVVLAVPLGLLATPALFRRGALGGEGRVRGPPPCSLAHLGARGLLRIFRSVPDLLWALLFVVAVGLGPAGRARWRWASPTAACWAGCTPISSRRSTPGRRRRWRRRADGRDGHRALRPRPPGAARAGRLHPLLAGVRHPRRLGAGLRGRGRHRPGAADVDAALRVPPGLHAADGALPPDGRRRVRRAARSGARWESRRRGGRRPSPTGARRRGS